MRTPKAWRQIHLLSVISKTLERIVHTWLVKEVDDSLSPSQFGTRRHRGVQDAAELMRDWVSRCRGKKLRMCFLTTDLEGGFDTVVPERLAGMPGFPPRYRSWLLSWCTGRRGRYRFNGRTSEPRDIPSGIPQGSPLSPYLFAIYVAGISGQDMLEIDTPGTMRIVLSYVDDFVLLLASRTEKALEKLTNESFGILVDRARERDMTFAPRKSKLSHQGRKATWTTEGGIAIQEELRVLGYWWANGGVGRPHLDHWLSRAGQTTHLIRAATSRGVGCPKVRPLQRLVTACVRAQVFFGIEA
jgi:hypothetical protein